MLSLYWATIQDLPKDKNFLQNSVGIIKWKHLGRDENTKSSSLCSSFNVSTSYLENCPGLLRPLLCWLLLCCHPNLLPDLTWVCFWWSSLFLVQLKITRACFVTLPFCPDLHRLSLRFRSWLILTERKLEDNRLIFNLDVYLTKLTFKLLPMFSICGFYRQLQNY